MKTFNVAKIYARAAMFSDGKERFCASGQSRVGKNHRDTFWIQQKTTLIWTQKRLKKIKKMFRTVFFWLIVDNLCIGS